MLCTLRRSQVSPGRQMLTHCAGAVTDAKSIQIGHQRFSVMLSVAAAADVLLLLCTIVTRDSLEGGPVTRATA